MRANIVILQNLERVIQDLVTENADLQSCVQAKDRELAQAQQQTRLKVKSTYSTQMCARHVTVHVTAGGTAEIQ